MKNILSIGFAFLVAMVLVTSCKKKNDNPVLSENAVKPILSIATPGFADTIKMNLDSAAKPAMDISYTKADFGYQAAVKYTIEMIQAGEDWSTAKVLDGDSSFAKIVSQAELNAITNKLGIPFGSVATLSTRVKAAIIGANVVTYSNVIDKVVKTYSTIIVYNKMWVPGDYQGWDPTVAQFLEEKLVGSGKFSGIIEKTKPNGTLSDGKFKMTPQPNWSYDFGDNGTIYTDPKMGSGAIGPKYLGLNGTNFDLIDGTYFITVDTTTATRTWSYSLENWGIVGDATPLDWPSGSGNDPSNTQDAQNMRYNPTTKMYEITIDLKGGKSIKFRKNDDWGVNLGWPSGADGDPITLDTELNGAQDGKNYGIVTDSKYLVQLDPIAKKIKLTKK